MPSWRPPDIGQKCSHKPKQRQEGAQSIDVINAMNIGQFPQDCGPYAGHAKGKSKKQTGYHPDFSGKSSCAYTRMAGNADASISPMTKVKGPVQSKFT